jgi:hypothetical protein
VLLYFSQVFIFQGDTDADFAISEMLLEEFNDIFSALAKVVLEFSWMYRVR